MVSQNVNIPSKRTQTITQKWPFVVDGTPHIRPTSARLRMPRPIVIDRAGHGIGLALEEMSILRGDTKPVIRKVDVYALPGRWMAKMALR